mgnify:FL=1
MTFILNFDTIVIYRCLGGEVYENITNKKFDSRIFDIYKTK